MAAERRRCRPGYTHEPYDCCGKDGGTYGRPKGQICQDCRNLIEHGKAAQAQACAAMDAGTMGVFRWSERSYAWPRFYGSGADIPGQAHDRLGDAFWEAVNVVTMPAPATTPDTSDQPAANPSWVGQKEAWPWLIEAKGTRRSWSESDWRVLRIADPAVREAMNSLHGAIMVALGAAYQAGKAKGSSILQQLASGELSLADFEDQQLPAADRNRRR